MEDMYTITPKTETEYLNTRVADQIRWFDMKSVKNKRIFLRLKVSEIILSLFIPFLSAYISGDGDPLKIVVGCLGILIAAIAGILTLVKYHENWVEYRQIAESLKMEKFLFLSKGGAYKDSADAYPLFAERFEGLIAASTKKWVEYVSQKDGKGNKKPD